VPPTVLSARVPSRRPLRAVVGALVLMVTMSLAGCAASPHDFDKATAAAKELGVSNLGTTTAAWRYGQNGTEQGPTEVTVISSPTALQKLTTRLVAAGYTSSATNMWLRGLNQKEVTVLINSLAPGQAYLNGNGKLVHVRSQSVEVLFED
jgi:hypothetical protein